VRALTALCCIAGGEVKASFTNTFSAVYELVINMKAANAFNAP
jgi:hypothetical protein